MPLTANFLADFSSFINACASATTSTDELVAAAGKVGATLDQAVAQAAGSLQRVGSGIAEFGKQAWSVLNSSQLKQFAGDVTEFVTHYVGEFAVAEAATARLENALKNSGNAAPEVAKKYGELASALQKVSTFSDEALTDAMTLFTTVGKVGPENMETALRATMDLAAGLAGQGMTLETAATLVAKALASDGEHLGKLRQILGDSIQPGASFAEIMDAINKKFGGASLAAVQTTAGAMENLKNQMSDIDERIGQTLAGNLKTLFDLFQSLPEPVQNFALTVYSIGKGIEPILTSLASLVVLLGSTGLGGAIASAATAVGSFVMVALEGLGASLAGIGGALLAAGEAVATFVAGLLGWPALIIAAIAALAIAIYAYWDDIVAFVKKSVEAIKGFLTVDLPNALKSATQSIAQFYYDAKFWLQDKFTGIFDSLKENVDLLPGYFLTAARQIVGFSIVPDMIDGIANEFARLDKVMVAPTVAATGDVTDAFGAVTGPTLSTAASAGALGRGAGGAVNVTVNMSGMLGTDDPQTRSMVADLVSAAVMQGMRGGRLMGTA